MAGNVNFPGLVQQQIRFQKLGARRMALNQWMVTGDGTSATGPGLTLLDAKGEPYRQTRAQSEMAVNNNVVTSQYVVSFQKKTGQAEPAKLIYSGSRTVTVDVPFELHDIPLP